MYAFSADTSVYSFRSYYVKSVVRPIFDFARLVSHTSYVTNVCG